MKTALFVTLLLTPLAVALLNGQGGQAPPLPADVEQWARKAWGVDPKTMGQSDTHFLVSLTESERQGAFLFKQRCNVCHYSTIASVSGANAGFETPASLGPELSKKTIEGKGEA